MFRSAKFFLSVQFLLIITCTLTASEFHVDKSRKNLVKFISDAKIETFDGTTDKIDGYFYWDGNDLLSKSTLYLEVDLRTIDTGIGLRNRHMRENYLETDKYPMAVFKGKLIRADQQQGGAYDVTAQGDMTIHGVTKPITVKGTLTPSEAGGYRISSRFELKLPDYNIPVPQMMFLKISEVMKMELDFFTKKIK
ncbi:MAG: YceI family protein [Syntrophothermus sp.]